MGEGKNQIELGKVLMEAFDIKEDRSRNDLTIVKRGLSIELTEVRDIADDIQFMSGETTLASLKELFENKTPAGHFGNVIAIVSAHEECPRFIAFMKKQEKRLKFKLIVFVSPLPASAIPTQDEILKQSGARRMQ